MMSGSWVWTTRPMAPSPAAIRAPTALVPMLRLATATSSGRGPAPRVEPRDDDRPAGALAPGGELAAGHAEQRHGALQHPLEDLRQLQLARQIGEGVEQRLLLAGAAMLGGEEPRVLDRDRRLRGEHRSEER